MKVVICAKDIEELKQQGQKTLYIDDNTLLTPSAKDAAKLAEIEIAQKPACPAVADSPQGSGISSELIYNALKALHAKGLLDEFLKDFEAKAFIAEACGGGKIVRGDSVKMETFDTGTPAAHASSQEVIDEDDSRIQSGFFTIDQSRFEQKFACEANFHLLEGSLNITINGEQAAVTPGDVLYIPTGANVVWDTSEAVRMFYSRYQDCQRG